MPDASPGSQDRTGRSRPRFQDIESTIASEYGRFEPLPTVAVISMNWRNRGWVEGSDERIVSREKRVIDETPGDRDFEPVQRSLGRPTAHGPARHPRKRSVAVAASSMSGVTIACMPLAGPASACARKTRARRDVSRNSGRSLTSATASVRWWGRGPGVDQSPSVWIISGICRCVDGGGEATIGVHKARHAAAHRRQDRRRQAHDERRPAGRDQVVAPADSTCRVVAVDFERGLNRGRRPGSAAGVMDQPRCNPEADASFEANTFCAQRWPRGQPREVDRPPCEGWARPNSA